MNATNAQLMSGHLSSAEDLAVDAMASLCSMPGMSFLAIPEVVQQSWRAELLDKPQEGDFDDALFYPLDNHSGPCWRKIFDPDQHKENVAEEEERMAEGEGGQVKEKGMLRMKLEEFVLEKLEVILREKMWKKCLELVSLKLYLVQVTIREEQSSNIFASFDTDKSGFIDRAELQAAIQKLGIKMTEEQLTEVMQKADDNEDGKIDRVEFREISYTILGLDGKGNPRGPEDKGTPFDDVDNSQRSEVQKESCGLLTDELPLVCNLANAMSGIIMAYRFRDDMPENKFKYIKRMAVQKTAASVTPYVLDILIEGKQKIQQHAKEEAETCAEAVGSIDAEKEIDNGVEQAKTVGGVRSEIQKLLKSLMDVLKKKMDESKGEFSRHPYLMEAKRHAREFGGANADNILDGIEGLIEAKIEQVANKVDTIVAEYVDEIVAIVTNPDMIQTLKSGTLLAKGAIQEIIEEELQKEDTIHAKTGCVSKPPIGEKTPRSRTREHELYQPILDLVADKVEEKTEWGMMKLEEGIDEMITQFLSVLTSFIRMS